LGPHGVFRVADDSLDPQVLLDEAEADLGLPVLLVDIGDGLGRQLEMVGEKDRAPAGGGIPVNAEAPGARPVWPQLWGSCSASRAKKYAS
jgi:hypothetical protein